MTYEEAKKIHIEMLKIDIKTRLHKMNPDKYPKVNQYSFILAFEVIHTLTFKNPEYKNSFEREMMSSIEK